MRTDLKLSSYARTFRRVLTANDHLSIQRRNAFSGCEISTLSLSKSLTKESSYVQDAIDVGVPVLEDLGVLVCM